jgi:hypothetical protein
LFLFPFFVGVMSVLYAVMGCPVACAERRGQNRSKSVNSGINLSIPPIII